MKAFITLLMAGALASSACSKTSADFDPKEIEAKYGVSGGFVDEVTTEYGTVKATIIPTVLDDGRKVQLIVPHQQIGDHRVYMRDGITITPMEVSDTNTTKQEFVQSQPRIERRPVATASAAPTMAAPSAPTTRKRSIDKEILIVGGSAGAGAAIGAISGGKKGAGVGALSGGVAGLVYDLATRNKK